MSFLCATDQTVQLFDAVAGFLKVTRACLDSIDGRIAGNGPFQGLHDGRYLRIVVAQALALSDDDRAGVGRIRTPDRYPDTIEAGVTRDTGDAEISQKRLDAS